MPVYVYKCDECGESIESIILSTDDIPVMCECGGRFVRQPTTANFRMYGGGVYKPSVKET